MNLGNVEWFLSLHMKTNPVGGWTNPSESISQIRSFPQVGMNITKIWNHHPVKKSCVWMLKHFFGGRIPDSRWGHWLSHKPQTENQSAGSMHMCTCHVSCVVCVFTTFWKTYWQKSHLFFAIGKSWNKTKPTQVLASHVRKFAVENRWATKKTLTTFHYTGWIIGILIMVYYNLYITG